jgi:hypothetical protein
MEWRSSTNVVNGLEPAERYFGRWMRKIRHGYSSSSVVYGLDTAVEVLWL